MSGSIPRNSRDKKRRKRACSALLDFQKKLQNACGTFQTANEWYEYVNELKDLIIQYTDLIPVPVQDKLNSITTLTDPTRDAINKACTLLSRDLKDIIEEFFPDILEEIHARSEGSEQQPHKPPYQRPEIIAPISGGAIAVIVIVALISIPEFDFSIYSDTQHLIMKAGESQSLYLNVDRIEGNTKDVFLNCDVFPPAPIRCIIDKNRIYPNPSETIKLTITVDKHLTSSHTVVLTGTSEGNARTHEFGVYVEPKAIPKLAVLTMSPKNNEELSSQTVPFTLKITSEDKPVQDAEVSIFLDNRKTYSLISNSNGLVSGKFTSVSYDEHSWYAKVGKSGYDPSETGHMYFVVSDTDSPLVEITWPSHGKFLNTNIIDIQGTASDKGSGIQNVMISIDGGMYQPVEGISSWSYQANLLDGPHTVQALVSDNFGRKTESIPVTVTVDTKGPDVSVIFSRNPDHNNYFTAQVEITWHSNEENVSCHKLSYSGPDGNTIKLDGSCTDKAGNSNFISTSINYDATPPQTKEVTAQDGNGTMVPNGRTTPSSQMRFFISASDTVDVDMDYECVLDGQIISCNQIFSISMGQHVMQITAIDDAGNKDQTPSVFTWTRKK